jgi:hypothetical protein
MGTYRTVGDGLGKGFRRLAAWRSRRPLLFGLSAGAALVGLFYGEEYCRGWVAWKRCKRELETKGAALDWAAFRPADGADEENFFKAPEMTNWFAGGSSGGFSSKLSLADFTGFAQVPNTNVLVEIRIVPPQTQLVAEEADLVLDYADSRLTLATPEGDPSGASDPASAVIPLIIMDEVPLGAAIRNLARQAGLNYVIDPAVKLADDQPQPTVSIRWENITARQALLAMLANYNLQMVGGSRGEVARVRIKVESVPKVEVEVATRARIEILLRAALERAGNTVPVRSCLGSQNLAFATQPLHPVKTLRVMVRGEQSVSSREVLQFLPTNGFTFMMRGGNSFRVEAHGVDSFRVFLGPPVYYMAAEYLVWSDRCAADFDTVRAALKRPYAQLATECEDPTEMMIPNFVSVRVLAQTLAQRAQCYLLFDQPEEALRELTLIVDLCRVVSRRPVALVPAMIDVAVTGLYVSTVAEGLRLNVWREPQLAAIEHQLEQVNLLSPLTEAFQFERYYLLRTFETGRLAKLLRLNAAFAAQSGGTNVFMKMRNASYSLLAAVPRGWIYQNMATVGKLHQQYLDAVDGRRKVICPREFDAAADRIEHLIQEGSTEQFVAGLAVPISHGGSAATFLAAAVFPNFVRAWQVAAHNQILVHEASLACALERHRLAHGRYPESLTALIPTFADALPLDVINGLPLRYQLRQDGTFLLYSTGWNGADDGGLVCRYEGGSIDLARGDWVWTAIPE